MLVHICTCVVQYLHLSPTRADNKFEKQLVSKLRGVMLHEDLEVVTSRQLRQKLEKEMDMTLNDYREFLDRHMLRILGQMERPSKILDYLYLVHNASTCTCACNYKCICVYIQGMYM